MTNDWENIAYWEETEHRGAGKQVWFVPNTVGGREGGGLGLVATPGKFRNFSPLLSLEKVVPSLKLTQNCYLNMNISFL